MGRVSLCVSSSKAVLQYCAHGLHLQSGCSGLRLVVTQLWHVQSNNGSSPNALGLACCEGIPMLVKGMRQMGSPRKGGGGGKHGPPNQLPRCQHSSLRHLEQSNKASPDMAERRNWMARACLVVMHESEPSRCQCGNNNIRATQGAANNPPKRHHAMRQPSQPTGNPSAELAAMPDPRLAATPIAGDQAHRLVCK